MDRDILKIYDILLNYNKSDFIPGQYDVIEFADRMFGIGFSNGLNACYYLFSQCEEIFSDDIIRDYITVTFFEKLYSERQMTLIKEIMASPALIKGFFTLSSNPYQGAAAEILTDFLISGKIEEAEQLLKAVNKNNYFPFNKGMKIIFELYIEKLQKKQDTLKPKLSRKTVDLLKLYINKIKSSEKPLLMQRINELI